MKMLIWEVNMGLRKWDLEYYWSFGISIYFKINNIFSVNKDKDIISVGYSNNNG